MAPERDREGEGASRRGSEAEDEPVGSSGPLGGCPQGKDAGLPCQAARGQSDEKAKVGVARDTERGEQRP